MSLIAEKIICAGTAIMLLQFGGCVSHDQVHLKKASPCRVRCQADYVAPLDPECHGYHPTCWLPWSCNCPPCPPPVVGVGEPYLETFEIAPEEIQAVPQPANPREEMLPPQQIQEAPPVLHQQLPAETEDNASTMKIIESNTEVVPQTYSEYYQ